MYYSKEWKYIDVFRLTFGVERGLYSFYIRVDKDREIIKIERKYLCEFTDKTTNFYVIKKNIYIYSKKIKV